ncbi:MAG: hypothetical protein KDB22_28020 [Planctomycetales bacterium]|nr:hypothetical protein [Planctomycetales bacterium]
MRCDEKLRFTAPADNSRPYGSHRFDTFCIKVGRRATVFGDLCLSALIRLEIDPSVLAYCERPMVLEDLKPKRVVDFWVKRTSGEELWFLLRPSEKAWPTGTGGPGKAFSTWASAQNLTVVLCPRGDIALSDVARRNWTHILCYLNANRTYVDTRLTEKVHLLCRNEISIKEIQNQLQEEDPVLVRTALFLLMYEGRVVSPQIESVPIGAETVVIQK